jgi:hypothetical protein
MCDVRCAMCDVRCAMCDVHAVRVSGKRLVIFETLTWVEGGSSLANGLLAQGKVVQQSLALLGPVCLVHLDASVLHVEGVEVSTILKVSLPTLFEAWALYNVLIAP